MSIFPTKVLLAVDGSVNSALAARTAAGLSAKTGSELHVVHVAYLVPPNWGSEVSDLASRLYEESREEARQEAQRLLDEQVKKTEDAGRRVTKAYVKEGRPDEEIVQLAEEIGAGLVVLGSRGLGLLKRALMGSVSVSVVRHAHCPVLVVRGSGRESQDLPGRILLAVDGSREAKAAKETAAQISRAGGSELHVVFVLPTEQYVPRLGPEIPEDWKGSFERGQQRARAWLDQQAEQIEAEGSTVAGTHLALGRPQQEIVRLGDELDADLIVLGSRGLGGVRRALMGSVSDSVVRHSRCSVLVVRAEGRSQAVPPVRDEERANPLAAEKADNKEA